MTFKKYNGKIFDVDLTPKEQKALEAKIAERLIEEQKMFEDDVDYTILYILHKYFGYGLKRLRRVYDLVKQETQNLVAYYQMEDAGVYIARKEMNAIGCNVEEWNKERSE